MCVNLVKSVFTCYVCGAGGSVQKLAAALGGRVLQGVVDTPKGHNDDWKALTSSVLALDHPYLASRGVTNDQVREFKIMELPMGVGFPLLSTRDRVIGLLVRRSNPGKWSRYVNYGERADAWPMSVAQGLSGDYAVVEGVFGALRGLASGIPTVATLGAAVQVGSSWMLNMGAPRVLFDNDQAGYLGGGRCLRLNPMAKVLIPGAEADELDDVEWKLTFDGAWTRNIMKLGDLYNDRREFCRKLPRVGWGWSARAS